MRRVTEGLFTRPVKARLSDEVPRVLAFGLFSALVLGLAGCGQGTPEPDPTDSFSRFDYCQAMHSAFPDIDAAAIAEGDEVALEKARDTYSRLAGRAPDRLEDYWATIITGLDSLIAQANGSEPVSSREFTAFRTAYSAIYEDYQNFCFLSPPASPSPS